MRKKTNPNEKGRICYDLMNFHPRKSNTIHYIILYIFKRNNLGIFQTYTLLI